MVIDPGSLDALRAVALGFAFSGLLASAFEATAKRRLRFGLLRSGDGMALACVPILVFSAPFVVLRGTLQRHRRERTFGAVFVATLAAGLWSLFCGETILAVSRPLFGA